MRRFVIRSLLVMVSLTMITSCKHRNESGYPIILLAPRSGAQSALGLQVDRARIMIENELRDAHDTTIAIYEVDTTSQPTVARAEAQRALAHYRSKFLVGSVLSGETRNFLEPVLTEGVVVLANGSSDPAIRALPFRHQKDGFFRNWPPDDAEGRAMAEYVHDTQQIRALAVFCADDAYSRGLTATFVRRFRELGGSANDPEIYPTLTTSFESVLSRIDSSRVEGYYIIGLPRDLAGIYDTIRRASKGNNLPVFTAVAAETSEFKALVDQPLNRLFYTSPDSDLTSEQYFTFKEAYMKQFNGEAPDIVASVTYDALHIMMDAVRAGQNDSERAKAYLYNMPVYQGTMGPTKFDERGDVISKHIAIHFYERGLPRLAELRTTK